jgi:hypothetical protein
MDFPFRFSFSTACRMRSAKVLEKVRILSRTLRCSAFDVTGAMCIFTCGASVLGIFLSTGGCCFQFCVLRQLIENSSLLEALI